MLKVTVTRSNWLRGEGSMHSYLLRGGDGKMCCLGYACQTLGYTRDDMLGKKVPWDLSDPPLLLKDTSEVRALMPTNDDPNSNEEYRESHLIELGHECSIEFEFVD